MEENRVTLGMFKKVLSCTFILGFYIAEQSL